MTEPTVPNSPSDSPADTTKVGKDWRENIKSVAPEYVAEWDEFKNSDSPEKFFSQIANHRKMLGQSIRIPGSDAGEQQMTEFWQKIQTKVPGLMRTPNPDNAEQVMDAFKKLGLPEKADEYNLGDGVTLDSETLGAYRAMAHAAKLTKQQFREFTKSIADRNRTGTEQIEAARKQDLAALRGEWGPAWEQRLEICAGIATKTGAPEGLIKAIKEGHADSASLRWLHSLATQFGGEGKQFLQSNQPLAPSTADLQGQIDDIMRNQQHPYWNASHPDHKKAVDKLINLRRTLAAVA